MPILDLRDAARLYTPPAPKPTKRALGDAGTIPPGLLNGGGGFGSFAAAKVDRLTGDFLSTNRSADQELFGDNQRIRARGRDLAKNNPYVRKFRGMLAQNVIGQFGIQLQAKVGGVYGKQTAQAMATNQKIEAAWTRWCRRCTADGKLSMAALQRQGIKTWGTEGEILTKLVYGRQYPCGIALQPLDNDQLDDSLMMQGQNGTTVRMGVEVDQYMRPLAYHLFNGHPFDQFAGSRERKRVDAKYVVHSAEWERPGQTRGYSPMAPVILSLKGHAGWAEATLIAARMSAAKPFAIERDLPTDPTFTSQDDDDRGENEEAQAPGRDTMPFNAGEGFQLDPGEHLNFIDPRFPTNTFAEFSDAMLREIASGLMVSYPSLANNLEGVNFSSIRAGLVDERDCWRVVQYWFIESFLQPIFAAWLEVALLTELQGLSLTDEQKEQMAWKPRGWAWVDPVKDADAAILRLGNCFSDYDDELGELGRDFEATVERRAQQQAFIESMQDKYKLRNPLYLGTDLAGDQGGKGVAADAEGEAAQVEGAKDDDQGSGGKGKQGKGGKGK